MKSTRHSTKYAHRQLLQSTATLLSVRPPKYSLPRCCVALWVQLLAIDPDVLLTEGPGQHVRHLLLLELHWDIRRVFGVEPHVVNWVVTMETVVKGDHLVMQGELRGE